MGKSGSPTEFGHASERRGGRSQVLIVPAYIVASIHVLSYLPDILARRTRLSFC